MAIDESTRCRAPIKLPLAFEESPPLAMSASGRIESTPGALRTRGRLACVRCSHINARDGGRA
jgi:hypothetical protein